MRRVSMDKFALHALLLAHSVVVLLMVMTVKHMVDSEGL